ncbi:MAG: hypothetical protein GF329_02410 [Candidatus Lokiarchaeota archaeon]|nr:hypothetical protein [Candidatus Lokiarchaeota archaeon]
MTMRGSIIPASEQHQWACRQSISGFGACNDGLGEEKLVRVLKMDGRKIG